MKISVIVPAYNCESTIERCINSIISQDCPDLYEIIVVDDGSVDRTGAIVQKIADVQDRLFLYRKENRGVSSARNEGLRIASGDYIMFADADDELKPNLLSKLCQGISQGELVVGGIELHQIKGVSMISKEGTFTVSEAIERYAKSIPGILLNGPCCKLFRKDIIESALIRFDPKISLGEDTVFVFQYLCKCSSVCFIDYTGYIYYQMGSESLMNKFRADGFYRARDVYKRLLQIVGDTAGIDAVNNIMETYSSVLLVYLRKAIANKKMMTKSSLNTILAEYLNDSIVQSEAEKRSGKSVIRRVTDVLTAHRCKNLLQLFLTLHVSIRGV